MYMKNCVYGLFVGSVKSGARPQGFAREGSIPCRGTIGAKRRYNNENRQLKARCKDAGEALKKRREYNRGWYLRNREKLLANKSGKPRYNKEVQERLEAYDALLLFNELPVCY